MDTISIDSWRNIEILVTHQATKIKDILKPAKKGPLIKNIMIIIIMIIIINITVNIIIIIVILIIIVVLMTNGANYLLVS